MITKYDTNDKVWIKGTVDSAMNIKGKIYYKIRECTEAIPEEICTREVIDIRLKPDTSEFDQIKNKIKHMDALLTEAMDIAQSIASLQLDLRINAVVNDKSIELAKIITEETC